MKKERKEKMRNGFEVEHHIPVSGDSRGAIFEWKLPDNHQITVCVRRKGVKGGHFHRGEDPSKNPERIFVAEGKMEIVVSWEDKTERIVLNQGDSMEIYPFVRHSFTFLEDTIVLEYRVNYFDKGRSDTYPL